MDATALRASTQAVTPLATSTAAAATTNGPSSSGSTAGGGPVPAPAQPTLLGTKLLPAPAGKPETIHLPDGSMLVPLAKVGADGVARALDGGGPATPATPTSPAPGPAATPATPTNGTSTSTAPGGGSHFEPGFLFRGNYYKKFLDRTAIDIANLDQVQDKVIRGTLDKVQNDMPELNGFGITDIRTRAVDPNADRDLLTIDPDAKLIVDVAGVSGTGQSMVLPSVVDADGDVFVDPFIRRW